MDSQMNKHTNEMQGDKENFHAHPGDVQHAMHAMQQDNDSDGPSDSDKNKSIGFDGDSIINHEKTLSEK